ncbi:MAG TPA: sialidase family protein, partial [Anaerolineales bacterium]|nr:sialidase family protein [Anaerolineales bacterium]
MTPSAQPARPWVQTSALIISLIALMLFSAQVYRLPGKAKQLRRSGLILNQVVAAPADGPVTTLHPPPGGGFAPQTRLGYTTGDQWEPAIAIDRNNHVYILYPQYLGVPGCSDCYSPTMILQISSDGGATWGSPTQIYPGGRTTGQWDAQIVVDPIDGSTVYAAWLQNGKSDIAVAKSTDFGASWSVVIADHTNAGTDKPILVVRGPDVYVSYNHAQTEWVSSSHDGGATFTSVKVNAPS